jgi:hypothetical protein
MDYDKRIKELSAAQKETAIRISLEENPSRKATMERSLTSRAEEIKALKLSRVQAILLYPGCSTFSLIDIYAMAKAIVEDYFHEDGQCYVSCDHCGGTLVKFTNDEHLGNCEYLITKDVLTAYGE